MLLCNRKVPKTLNTCFILHIFTLLTLGVLVSGMPSKMVSFASQETLQRINNLLRGSANRDVDIIAEYLKKTTMMMAAIRITITSILTLYLAVLV